MKMHGCVFGFEHFGHGPRGLPHMRCGRGGGPRGLGLHGFGHHGHGPHGFGPHGFGPHGFGPHMSGNRGHPCFGKRGHGHGHHDHGPHGPDHHAHGSHGHDNRGHGPHGPCHRGHGHHGHGLHGKFGHGKHGSELNDLFEQFLAFHDYQKLSRVPDAVASQAENSDGAQDSACDKERESGHEQDCNELAEKRDCHETARMRPCWGKRRGHRMHKTMEAIRKARKSERQCKCGKRGGEGEQAGSSVDASAVQDLSAVRQEPLAALENPAEGTAVQEENMTSVDKPTPA